MIADGFIFFNELDVLEIRLRELDPVVDRFVLAEGTRTFQGNPKPLYFADNRDRYARWLSKITHVVVDDWPGTDDPWVRERFQRNAIERGFAGLPDEALVMISDCDEIPRAAAVADSARVAATRACAFRHAWATYWLDWWLTAQGAILTRMATFADLRLGGGPHNLRNRDVLVVEHGGWHFSSVGGVDSVCQKMSSFSHTELTGPEYSSPQAVTARMAAELMPNGDRLPARRAGLWELPGCVAGYPELWSHLMKPGG